MSVPWDLLLLGWWMLLVVLGTGILAYLLRLNIGDLRATRTLERRENLRRVAVASLMNTLSLLGLFTVLLAFALYTIWAPEPPPNEQRLLRSFVVSLSFFGVVLARFCEAKLRSLILRS